MELIAILVAGGAILMLADIAPELALGTMGIITLAAIMAHADQLQALSKYFQKAQGA